jgi:enoyl-CoA hydratase/carnithine racemase
MTLSIYQEEFMNIVPEITTTSTALTGEPILLRHDQDGVATLTLNRPKQFNALSEAMLSALQTELDRLAADSTIRVVVLAAKGKAFCAGHDLKEMRATPTQDYYTALFNQCSHMMLTINRLPQPVIARVHGIATAAGCQLVAACDLAVAVDSAQFATSGINVGLFCATPAVPVSRNVPRKQAMEMLLTGEFIDAPTALQWGLVNRVVPAEQLDPAVAELVQSILAKSFVAVSAGKHMFYRQLEMSLSEAYLYASQVMAGNMMSEDAAEGIDAFIQKREPTWKHR